MSTPESNPSLTREQLAFYVKTFWSALSAPTWSRDDLIELGKAIYAKTPLDKLNEQQFQQLLPQLSIIARKMGEIIQQNNLVANPPSNPPQEPSNG